MAAASKPSVWVVELCYAYEGCEVMAVFTNKELAKAYVDNREEAVSCHADYTITEWVLDAR